MNGARVETGQYGAELPPTVGRANRRRWLSPLVVTVTCALAGGPASPHGWAAGPGFEHEDGGWMVDRWTIEDGLPLNHVADIIESPRGFIWLATFDGLVRFDGYEFEVFRRSNAPELGTDRFYDLEIDERGDLWIAGEPNRIIVLRGGRFIVWELPLQSETGRPLLWRTFRGTWATYGSVYRLESEGPELVARDALPPDQMSIAGQPDGTLWLGSRAGGLKRLGPDGETAFVPMEDGAQSALSTIPHATRSGGIWMTSRAGLHRYSDGRMQRVRVDGTRFCKVMDGPDGEVLVRSVTRWWAWDGASLVNATGVPPPTYAECEASRSVVAGGALWEAAGGALWRNERMLARLDQQVEQIFVDSRHHIWVGTRRGGLLRLRPPVISALGRRQGLPIDNVPSVVVDAAGTLWMDDGTDGYVSVHRGEFARVRPIDLPDTHGTGAPRTFPAMVDREGAPWAMTSGGVCRLRGGGCAPNERLSSSAWAHGPAHQDADGRLWIATTDRGLMVVSDFPDGDRWAPAPGGAQLGSAMVRRIVGSPAGSILVGTAKGDVLRYPAGGGAPAVIRSGRGFTRSPVRDIWVDDADYAWIGTEAKGLCRVAVGARPISAKERPRCLDRSRGLPADTIHSVIGDGQNRIWMSSNLGISVADRGAMESAFAGEADHVLTLTLDEHDGMVDREANGFRQPAVARDADGRLWYPTQAGLASIAPGHFPSPAPPPVYIESVVAGGVEVESEAAHDSFALPSEARSLAVTWSSPELVWPEQVRFRHRLVGFDEAWSAPTRERAARWDQLPPGSYRLEVQAGLIDWGEPTAIEIRRAAAFTETWWFLAFLLLLGGMAATLVVWFTSRQTRRRQARLEALVAERTASLTESERLSRDRARRLIEFDTIRTRCVTNISHELRTPLTLLRAELEDATQLIGAHAPEASARVRSAQAVADQLDDLVEQLFETARLASGGMKLRVRHGDLAAFVDRASRHHRREAKRQGIDLRVIAAEAPVPVFFDPDSIGKVISNLLSNALAFTEAGGAIHVEVEAPSSDEPDEAIPAFARVSVWDTGVGIPASEVDRVFERFHQVDCVVTQGRRGGGIGLSLARELVELHGGEIGAISEARAGARFWFTLPMGAAHLAPEDIALSSKTELPDAAPGGPSKPVSPGDERSEESDGLLIMVVEDHPQMRAYLVARFQRMTEVVEAANGREALELIRLRRPAVVVSDVIMPEMDGIALCQAVRADPELAGIRLLLVTAKSALGDRIEGLSVADDLVTKPFRIQELSARVRKQLVLAGRRPVGASAKAGFESEPSPAEPESGLTEAQRAFVERNEQAVLERLSDADFTATVLAKAVGLSPRQHRRRLLDLVSQSPAEFIRIVRLAEARRLLQRGRFDTIAEVAAAVGMSPSYLSRAYAAHFGVIPSKDVGSS